MVNFVLGANVNTLIGSSSRASGSVSNNAKNNLLVAAERPDLGFLPRGFDGHGVVISSVLSSMALSFKR